MTAKNGCPATGPGWYEGWVLLTAVVCLPWLPGCSEELLGQRCSAQLPCPPGQLCGPDGYCRWLGDGAPPREAGWPDQVPIPDAACPSSMMCGKPARCCKPEEECVEGSCLPFCPSGIRCLDPHVLCCKPDQVCLSGQCVPPGKRCRDSFDCPLGFFCEPTLGRCLPQPTGRRCEVRPTSVSFKPKVEWSWTGYSLDTEFHEVAATPAVADLDADGTPEVAVVAYTHSSSSNAMLVVLDGATGNEELAIPHSRLNMSAWCGVALGNLDADKQLEIVAVVQGLGVVALEHDGTIKWSSAAGSLASAASRKVHPQPALSDLDADGSPEVVVGGVVLDRNGKLLFDRGMLGANSGWVATTTADLDEDGKLELVAGNAVYRHDGRLLWASTLVPDGLTAVGDMDMDGWGDVINISAGRVRVLRGSTKAGKMVGEVFFGPIAIPGGGVGGPPTVGDFDGDGHPELSAAGKGFYTVYDPDCWSGSPSAACRSGRGDGVLWSVATQDISSSVTGSSLFDFQGDGSAEVVYNDECHLHVFDGKTGAQLMQLANTSRTAMEYPLIADVDGDNNSEFVVPANDDQIVRDRCSPPGTRGIRVFGDSADRWVRTRPVWNQHSYHITNISAAGKVPAVEQRNWDAKGLNNFRQNVQGAGIFNAPDLQPVGLGTYTGGCPVLLELRARASNTGSLGVKSGIRVAFYRGKPPGGILLGTVSTNRRLLPGESQLLTLTYPVPPGNEGPFDFWVRVDDDGTGKGAETECDETNNIAAISGVRCPAVK